MIVTCVNQQRKYPVDYLNDIVCRTAEAVWMEGSVAARWKKELTAGVTIAFVSENRIRMSNRETRGIDRTTDVLSFPMLDMEEGRLSSPLRAEDIDRTDAGKPVVWLGDILICPARAEWQAKTYGHSLTREIAFLTAHGLLHLMGYDHNEPAKEAAMTAKQEQTLNRLGIRRIAAEGETT